MVAQYNNPVWTPLLRVIPTSTMTPSSFELLSICYLNLLKSHIDSLLQSPLSPILPKSAHCRVPMYCAKNRVHERSFTLFLTLPQDPPSSLLHPICTYHAQKNCKSRNQNQEPMKSRGKNLEEEDGRAKHVQPRLGMRNDNQRSVAMVGPTPPRPERRWISGLAAPSPCPSC